MLFLLSRINGDAFPANQAAAFWMIREQAEQYRSHSFEYLNASPSLHTVFPKPNLQFKASLIPNGERSINMSMKLYIGNLAFQTSSDELQQLFSQVGAVESANII
jgi:RNA recognition motif-containing protein